MSSFHSQSSARKGHASSARSRPESARRTESARRARRNSEQNSPCISRGGDAASLVTSRTGGNYQKEGNAVKVYIRVRPYNEREIGQANMSDHSTVRIDKENPELITILDPARDFRPTDTYSFAKCFWSVFDKEGTEDQKGLRNTVDVYINGSLPRPRSRAMSLKSQEIMNMSGRGGKSARDPLDSSTAQLYVGSGSNAAVVAANVTHPPYADQAEIYKEVGKPILENSIDGYNGCVFAYGQTGSGKTFTMLGYAPKVSEVRKKNKARRLEKKGGHAVTPMSLQESTDDLLDSSDMDLVGKDGMDPNQLQGIIPRICEDLFLGLREKQSNDGTLTYRVHISYYEIYQEKVFDLLRPQRNSDLKVGNNPITGPYVDGLTSRVVNNEEDIIQCIHTGMQERHTAQTTFNDRSSRSHAILSIHLLQVYLDSADSTCKMESKLNLVDLAGSERAGAAGVDRPEYEEGVKINQSLTVLGRVIDCLADLSQNRSLAVPVPYRESKLTLLLMDSLGGNSQTSMIATISPHMINYEEMRQTIRYSSRAKRIVNRAVRNEDPQVVYIRELRAEVDRLQQLLKEAGGHEFTREYVLELEERCRQLEKKCREQEECICSLRVELEQAGISDPTLRKSNKKGKSSDENNSAAAVSGASVRKANEALQQQLQTATKEIERLQKELLDRAGAMASSAALQEAETKLASAQRQMDVLRHDIHERDALLRRYSAFQHQWTADIICNTVFDKLNVVFRQCQGMLYAKDQHLSSVLNSGQVSNLVLLNEQQKRHEEETNILIDRYRSAQDAAEAEYAVREQEAQRKHREGLALVESKLKLSKDSYEEEKKRMAGELDSMKFHYEGLLAKAATANEEQLQRLREKVGSSAGDRQKLNDVIRQQQEQHDQEVKSVRDEAARVERKYDAELTKLRTQHAAALAAKESELTEKDRQRRKVELEVSDLRRDNLKLQSEYKKADREQADRIKDLVQQQEALVTVTNATVSDWESGSPTLEASMGRLREFVRNSDYTDFRQQAKDMAFRGNAAFSATSKSARPAPSPVMDAEREKEFRDTVSRMRAAQASHQASMEKLQRDLYEGVSKARGYERAAVGKENSTPPPPTTSKQ